MGQIVEPAPAVIHQSLSFRGAISCCSKLAHVVKDLAERLRREPENLRRFRQGFDNLRDFISRRRTNLAKVLRQDQIRSQLAQKVFINLVKTLSFAYAGCHRAIDLALTHPLERQHSAHDYRLALYLGWIVAIVRNARDRVTT